MTTSPPGGPPSTDGRLRSAVPTVAAAAPSVPLATNGRCLVGVGVAPRHVGEQPRRLSDPDLIDHPLATGRYQSPLRYPGAKSALAPTISRLVESAKTSTAVGQVNLFVEPFAGGASVSLRLVGAGVVDQVLLADADPLVAAFWQVAAEDTSWLKGRARDEWDRFVSKGGATAVDRWDHWRLWTPPPGATPQTSRREAAVKALFLNRTTFSGILHGRAGPIGGRGQTSTNGIGCRWNPDSLEERLAFIGHLYSTNRLLDVWCMDWSATLDSVASAYKQLLPSRVVAYLDPPYVEKSAKLYQRSFDPHGGYAAAPVEDLHWGGRLMHERLAEYLRTKAQFRWVLSYDAHDALTTEPCMYAHDRMTPSDEDRAVLGVRRWRISKRLVSTRYSASTHNGRGVADELLLTTLPPSTVPVDADLRMLPC